MISPLHSPEGQALHAGLRGMPPVHADLDGDVLLALARRHQVGPLLHAAWSSSPASLPDGVRAALVAERREAAVHAIRSAEQRREVRALLSSAGIPHLVLKGAALAFIWYGDPSLRPCHDLDLLLPPASIKPATRVLDGAGYRPVAVRLRPGHHHTAPLVRPQDPGPIELHRRPGFLPPTGWPSFDELAARAITVNGNGETISTLSPEDTLLLLCTHLLGGTRIAGGWRWRQLCDIARHLDAFSLDWDRVEAAGRSLRVVPAYRAVLGLATALLPVRVPAEQVDAGAGPRLLPHALPLPLPTDVSFPRLSARLAFRSGETFGVEDLLRAGPVMDSPGIEEWEQTTAAPILRPAASRPRRAHRLLVTGLRHPMGTVRALRRGVAEAQRQAAARAIVTRLLPP